MKKQIRQNFRNQVFTRDNFTCVFCDCKEKLDAHHITDRKEMLNGGYVKENGITVCPIHHLECEQFHISEGKDWVSGKHPNDLYKIINSSKELAIKKIKGNKMINPYSSKINDTVFYINKNKIYKVQHLHSFSHNREEILLNSERKIVDSMDLFDKIPKLPKRK